MAKKKTSRKVAPRRDVLAAIDVGSNGIRLAIGAVIGDRLIQRIESVRAPVRLGKDVFSQGFITANSAKEVIRAFLKFQKILRKYKARDVRVIATSAVREAKNRKKFVQLIESQTGLKPEAIDGDVEAQFIFDAVSNHLDLRGKQAVLLDIGGGSVEITIANNNVLMDARSLPLGTVRLLSKANQQFMPVQKSIEQVFSKFNSKLEALFEKHLTPSKPVLFIGTGGNIEALLKLRQVILHKSNSKCILKSELLKIIRKLNSYSYLERIQILRLRPDRADVIIPASHTVLNIMKLLNAEAIVVPCVGLKEGVLLDLAKSYGKKKDPHTPLHWTLT